MISIGNRERDLLEFYAWFWFSISAAVPEEFASPNYELGHSIVSRNPSGWVILAARFWSLWRESRKTLPQVSQTGEQYSKCGWTMDWYTVFNVSFGTRSRILLKAPSPFETFLVMALMWGPQLRFSSMITPKDLVSFTRVSYMLPIVTTGSELKLFNLLRDAIATYSLLTTLRLRRFDLSQTCKRSRSAFNLSSIMFMSLLL